MKYFHIILVICSLNAFAQNDCAKVNMNYSGYCFEFYPNGKTKWIKEFEGRKAIGIWLCFDAKGNLIKQLNTSDKSDSLEQIYDLKIVIEEDTHDVKPAYIYQYEITNATNDTIYSLVEEEAKFMGDMKNFFDSNFIFPASMLDISYYSRVYIKFVVEKDGSITNVSITKSAIDCLECDKEVMRVIAIMPNWKPAFHSGRVVRSWCQIPFTIKR